MMRYAPLIAKLKAENVVGLAVVGSMARFSLSMACYHWGGRWLDSFRRATRELNGARRKSKSRVCQRLLLETP
jgi:hypothetical protein